MLNITSKGDELLETKLNEVTSPLNPTFNEQLVASFCDQVNKEPEGHQIAVRLLAHKVQSPQEKEALYAFNVLDECVKRCGSKFHQEVGKFRFLNELIKIISPKYLARSMSNSVKTRCTECLYSLYKGIPNETKISEAYNMLKKQKIILKDPTYLDDKIYKVADKNSSSIFDSSKDSERLSRLLKSRNPDDLREANRIIKSIVQEDNQRMEMLSKRASEIETMKNNIKLLNEMLGCYNATETTSDDMDIMKQLIENLEQSRAEMFKLSRETDDNDFINDVIKVIDECNVVVKHYWEVTSPDSNNEDKSKENKNEVNLLGDDIPDSSNQACTSESILSKELGNFGLTDSKEKSKNETNTEKSDNKSKYDDLIDVFSNYSNTDSSLQSNIIGLNLTNDSTSAFSSTSVIKSSTSSNITQNTITPITSTTSNNFLSKIPSKYVNSNPNLTNTGKENNKNEVKGFEDLDILSQELLNMSKKKNGKIESHDDELISTVPETSKSTSNNQSSSNDMPLLMTDLLDDICNDNGDNNNIKNNTDFMTSNISKPTVTPTIDKVVSDPLNKLKTIENSTTKEINEDSNLDLKQFNVTLASIKPHSLKPPLTIYMNNESQLKIILHFANDQPHEHVHVLVAQIASENPNFQITDIVLKFAVSKPMKIRKQSSGITTLQSHSPFTPSTPINEIILLYNPSKSQAVLKFQLSYEVNGESYLESGTSNPIGF